MVLIRTLLFALLFLLPGIEPPAAAHPDHDKNKAAVQAARVRGGATLAPSQMQDRKEEQMEVMEDRQPKTFVERLFDWFGRMHPFAVHFPIALFPVAFVSLILARRRGEAVELIRALIIIAGIGSVIAAALGWLNGGLTIYDTDNVLMMHRWLGTILGLFGGLVGLWVWRRRTSVNSRAIVSSIGVIVALLLVQGFLGASVTHGMEHMMF